jgi:hypothetical protein
MKRKKMVCLFCFGSTELKERRSNTNAAAVFFNEGCNFLKQQGKYMQAVKIIRCDTQYIYIYVQMKGIYEKGIKHVKL